jgi:hypothetical protein
MEQINYKNMKSLIEYMLIPTFELQGYVFHVGDKFSTGYREWIITDITSGFISYKETGSDLIYSWSRHNNISDWSQVKKL